MRKPPDEYTPYLNLIRSTVSKAVNDLLLLRKHGMIDGWEVIKEWPMSENNAMVYCDEYRCPADAEQLIWYFTSGAVNVHTSILGQNKTHKTLLRHCTDLSFDYIMEDEDED